jgi:ABC-type nitrate/sulfonate/bicarbonate transport system substrate-binding protein
MTQYNFTKQAEVGLNMQPLKVIVFQGVQNLPNMAAETQGFFTQRELAVETIFTKGSDQMRDGLARGDYDIAHGAVDNAVAMVEVAKQDVFIFCGLDQGFNKLVVRPEISSYKDLRGKTFGVDAPDTAFALIAYDMLKRKGLNSGDYVVLPIGATRFRLEALKEGKIDFAMLNLPFNIFAQTAGLKILDDPANVIGAYQSAGGFARRDWAAANRDVLIQYVAAYIEGVRWALDPRNRKAAALLMRDKMKLDAAVVEQCLDQMLDERTGFAVDAKLNRDGMATLLSLRAKFTGAAAMPASRYVDEAVYREALTLLAR